ncbi:MAG TPA: CBS domain-containing protein, partial [Pyrodictium sp.]|nr:CBS domain-containing protein [Pyrodictium sp.]
MSGTSLLDLQVFLQSKVFPHLPQHDIDHLLSCTKVVLLKRGEKRSRKALYVVYRGRVRIDSEELVSGEYRLGKHIEAIEESIVLEIDEKCVSGVQLAPPVIIEEECRINRLVKRSPITVSPTTSVIDAVKIMAEHGVSSVVVVDGEKPIGIFTDTDLRKLVASGGELYKPIAEYMSRNLITISSEASCLEAVYRMMLYNIKHLVVVDAFEKLVGVVTVRDIAYIYGPYHLYYIRRIRSSHNIEELL